MNTRKYIRWIIMSLFVLVGQALMAAPALKAIDITVGPGQTVDGEIVIHKDGVGITSVQTDMYLPMGVTLTNVKLSTGGTDHQCSFVRQSDGAYRIVVASATNASLAFRKIIYTLSMPSDIISTDKAKLSNNIIVDVNGTKTKAAVCPLNIAYAGNALSMELQKTGDSNGLLVSFATLAETEKVTSIQADIVFDSAVEPLTNADGSLRMIDVAQNHTVSSSKIGDNAYRIVVSSMSNAPFSSNEVFVLPISMNGGNVVQASWTNAKFVLTNGVKLNVEASSFTGEITLTPEYGYRPVATDGETVQYLLNVDSKAFLVGANEWGTRASVSIEHGYKVKVKANGDGTYTINDFVENKSSWNAVDCQGAGEIWVDGKDRGGWTQWVVMPVDGDGENVYEITNQNVSGKLGVKSDLSNPRLFMTDESDYATRWAFLDEAGYNAYLESRKDDIEREKQKALDMENTKSLVARKALIDGTNVYDADGYYAYVAQYNSYMAQLEAGTLKETVVNPNAATGWHSSTEYNFLLTPWLIGGESASNFDTSLYINTWSVEGESDGSNFLVPFFEYWTNDDNSLGQNEITGYVRGLNPGDVYDVTLLARVRVKNGETNPHGITMSVGSGKSIDICSGQQVGDSQMYLGEFTAQGTVSIRGNIVININIADDNNVSWLAFKNVTYVQSQAPVLVTIEDITSLISEYLQEGSTVVINDITNLIQRYLEQ